MAHILIADETDLSRVTARSLCERGHTVHCVQTGDEALQSARSRRGFNLGLIGLQVRGMDGLELLQRLRLEESELPLVLVTPSAGVREAVRAMRLGAIDVLVQPLGDQAFRDIDRLAAAGTEPARDEPLMVGDSTAFQTALHLALRFAVPDINILLVGETGTGKELFARAIHRASRRAAGPFVPVDCSTLAESLIESELFGHEKGSFTGATGSRIGRFELAQNGTLFLDEIGNLPTGLQAKLLRVLQTRQLERVGGREPIRLNVRVVAATNVDLMNAIAAGRFRQDLYFRLQEMTLALPPLRARGDDVRSIAEHFVSTYARQFDRPVRGISHAALDALQSYDWPGNVRELENAMKSAVVLASDLVMPEHLPAHVLARAGAAHLAGSDSHVTVDEERLRFQFDLGVRGTEVDLKALGARAAEQAERSLLQALIRRGPRNGAYLARCLSVDPKTLRLKLRRYGLDAEVDGRRTQLDPCLPPTPDPVG